MNTGVPREAIRRKIKLPNSRRTGRKSCLHTRSIRKFHPRFAKVRYAASRLSGLHTGPSVQNGINSLAFCYSTLGRFKDNGKHDYGK
jgi:hypothetical protein